MEIDLAGMFPWAAGGVGRAGDDRAPDDRAGVGVGRAAGAEDVAGVFSGTGFDCGGEDAAGVFPGGACGRSDACGSGRVRFGDPDDVLFAAAGGD
ncbi:MAG: hypothetical protein JW885_15945 [Deltaproteobacteria bacterium]|nr:hypothetical protein [Candidatus Zymogenaceae bacterium]